MSAENRVHMTLRLSKEDNELVEQYAKANTLTKAGAIRQLIRMATRADDLLRMDADDSALGRLIAEMQESSVEELLEATDLAKNRTEYLTPEQSSELINAMGKLRSAINSYKNELNKIGNNINQIARKYNSTDSLEERKLMRLLKASNKNWKVMKNHVDIMVGKVEKIWDMVR